MNTRADVADLGCVDCHGDGARVANLAGTDVNFRSTPPVTTTGASPSAVGAHLGHMNPTAASALMPPMACSECHVVPADFDHANNPPAQRVAFGVLARTGGAAPTYVAGTLGCAATYCHGNFNYAGVAGTNATPLWSDTAPLTCTSCHGMPPTGHVAVAAPITAASCAACHPDAVNPNGSINLVAKGHLNGKPDTSAVGCSTCHGDATRTGNLPGTDANLISSPPVASASAKPYAIGAHIGHVNPTAASFLMDPVACVECHVVPTDSTHAKTPPAQKVVFGPISRTGGAIPTWTSTTTGCAATYCHGNFTFNGVSGSRATPLWTDTAALTCTSCHGMPPTGHIAVGSATAASCATCHPDAVNSDGTINRTAKGHLNGKADVNNMACNSCHGDPNRKPNLTGTDANLTSAPPVAQPGAPASTVGSHMGHMNPTATSYAMAPIACAECHVVPTDVAHATNPPADGGGLRAALEDGRRPAHLQRDHLGLLGDLLPRQLHVRCGEGLERDAGLDGHRPAHLHVLPRHAAHRAPDLRGRHHRGQLLPVPPDGGELERHHQAGRQPHQREGRRRRLHRPATARPPPPASTGSTARSAATGATPPATRARSRSPRSTTTARRTSGSRPATAAASRRCPPGTRGNCTVNCHGENHQAERW